jgi:hypothetical protein
VLGAQKLPPEKRISGALEALRKMWFLREFFGNHCLTARFGYPITCVALGLKPLQVVVLSSRQV